MAEALVDSGREFVGRLTKATTLAAAFGSADTVWWSCYGPHKYHCGSRKEI